MLVIKNYSIKVFCGTIYINKWQTCPIIFLTICPASGMMIAVWTKEVSRMLVAAITLCRTTLPAIVL
tara:strand:- start:344 stop:544 length:201 start_codon:yes stop_codon:yes gene_type:complete